MKTDRVGYLSDEATSNVILKSGHYASVIGSNDNTDCIRLHETSSWVYKVVSNPEDNISYDITTISFKFEKNWIGLGKFSKPATLDRLVD